jgi:amidase
LRPFVKVVCVSHDLSFLDACAQAELVRTKKVSPLELVNFAIATIERLNPSLNAIVWERFEKARDEARGSLPDGPFRGVPFLTKDLGCTTAGEPDSQGSRFLKNNQYMASVTTELARRIRAAGFINLGRTNSPEFGAVATTEPLAWGPTRNPWDTNKTPAGSSGGSCAAVASGMVAIAHGSDGGGSIRLPAAACGLVGLKPTRGRVSMCPGSEWVSPVSVQGFQTRSVRDTAVCLDIASGPAPGDPMPPPRPLRPYRLEVGAPIGPLRIGLWLSLPQTIGGELHAECRKGVEETGRLLESLGHQVEVAHPSTLDDPKTNALFSRIWPVRLLAAIESFERKLGKKATEDDLDPATLFWIERARHMPAAEYVAALDEMDGFARTMAAWWASGFDVLVTPTTGTVTPKIGELGMDAGRLPLSLLWSPYTAYFNMSGQPAVSLPLHWAEDGMPVGVQLAAAHGREDVLIRLSSQLETARPWSGRIPPLH